MASTISQPCYATREDVARALDVKAAAYNSGQIDRQIVAATDSVENLCKRRFYPVDATRSFDWPNFQYTYPWRLYLDQHELAAPPTLFESGQYNPTPVVIPSGAYILQPINSGPPYRWIDLRRDQNYSFGNNPTPQNDILIQGSFGYWMKTTPVGTITAALTDTTGTAVQASVSSGSGAGVGDTLFIDSERMIVTDATYVSTGINYTSGLASNPPSAADNTIGVPSGPAFAVGEPLVIDSEVMLIQYIVGNNLVVKRAFDGSALATHTPGTAIYARRQLTVIRGALGTTAATHTQGTVMSILSVPSLVKQYAVAEALIGMVQEPGAYVSGTPSTSRSNSIYGGTSHAQVKEAIPGIGLPGLQDRMVGRYGRQARSRVV
jgi:hypothetical protein